MLTTAIPPSDHAHAADSTTAMTPDPDSKQETMHPTPPLATAIPAAQLDQHTPAPVDLLGDRLPVIALIESALGIDNAMRIAHLPGPIDGPTLGADLDQVRAHTLTAVELGLAGKLALDPTQGSVIDDAASRSLDDIVCARQLLRESDGDGISPTPASFRRYRGPDSIGVGEFDQVRATR